MFNSSDELPGTLADTAYSLTSTGQPTASTNLKKIEHKADTVQNPES